MSEMNRSENDEKVDVENLPVALEIDVVKNVKSIISLLPKRRKKVTKNYKQFYRKVWEEVPEFKDWLCEIPGDRTLAYCRICQKTLHAHRLSLTKHTVSLKHSRLAQKKASEINDLEVLCQASGVCCQADWADQSDDDRRSPGGESGVMDVDEESLAKLEEEDEVATERVISVEEVATSVDDDDRPTPPPLLPPLTSAQEPKQPTSATATLLITQRKLGEKQTISTHVLDMVRGIPAAGLAVSLYQLVEGRWTLVKEGQTNGDGRCSGLGRGVGRAGRYKLHFDTDRYFDLFKTPSLYPFVEIVFDVCSPEDKYHIPLLLSPYGYSTYKGS